MSQEKTTDLLTKKVNALPEGVLKVVALAYLNAPEGLSDREMSKIVYASGCTVRRWRNTLKAQYDAVFNYVTVKGIRKYILVTLK